MPHSHCYALKASLIRMNFLTDMLIGIAYASISLTLAYLVKRIRLPFHWMFLAFGAFIAACGATHFMEVITLETPIYWTSTLVKLITALASVSTAICLPFLVPHIENIVQRADESAQRKQQLEMALDEARRANEARGRFLATVSHELRTPLNSIVGFTDVLLEMSDEVTPHQKKSLNYIRSGGQHLLQLINDLLDFARIDTGKLELHLQPQVNVSHAIEEVVSIVAHLAEAKSITLSLPDPSFQPAVTADAARLRQILFNLLSNAIKFTPSGGQVSVGMEASTSQLKVSVTDTGIGIEPADQARIFQPFEQVVSHYHPQQEGTGLGLAITNQLILAHGWRLELDSTPQVGSRFSVVMPKG